MKRYHDESPRMPQWDYSGNGFYFLTLVTTKRKSNLAWIEKDEGKVIITLKPFGQIVEKEWFRSFEIRDELLCHEYVMMPNHIHALVQVVKWEEKEPKIIARDPIAHYGRPMVRKPMSISSFMAGFKSAVNSRVDDYIDLKKLPIMKFNSKNHFFQANCYDWIVRDQKAYDQIRNYIRKNPEEWASRF